MPKIAYVKKNFRAESLAIIQQARRICEEYAADGYDLTLRQLYYQFVARGLIPNTQKSYDRLGGLVNDARLAGIIDWNHLVDRTRNLSDLSHWESPADIIAAVASQFRLELWKDQPVRVEVWVEKEALAGVVSNVCQRLDVPFFACRGYVSQSEQWRAGQRIGEYLQRGHERVVIIHLGDHDPSGIDMTRDIRERLEMFLEHDFLDGYGAPFGLDRDDYANWPEEHRQEAAHQWAEIAVHEGWDSKLQIRRIALNYDQVEEFNPPPNPAKLTDSRAGKYVDEFGYTSWELDALPPDVLAGLIEDTVAEYRDEDLWEESLDRQISGRRQLRAVSDQWFDVVDFVHGDL